ncbi:unnamed protein product [Sphagnum jensenii]|uniref:Transposase n=1 Tax=Sphagnum jensenii TaxID=128206 RepID=A0ABP0VDH8_9BRYO
MKKNSKTGLYGVEEYRDRFKAVHETTFKRKTIAETKTKEAAAMAFDDYLVQAKGVLHAWANLNYPEVYRAQHDQAIAARVMKNQESALMSDQFARSIQPSPMQLAAMIKAFQSGVPVEKVASEFGIHPDTTRELLKKAETDRLVSVGLLPGSSPVNGASIRARVKELHAQGVSGRKIAEEMGLDKKLISKLLLE